jgi:hypothetical protein
MRSVTDGGSILTEPAAVQSVDAAATTGNLNKREQTTISTTVEQESNQETLNASLADTSPVGEEQDDLAALSAETARFEEEFSRERSRSLPPPTEPQEPEEPPRGAGDGRRDRQGRIHCNSCSTIHRYR